MTNELYKYTPANNGQLARQDYIGKWFIIRKGDMYLHRYTYGNSIIPTPRWTPAKKFALKLQEDGATCHVGTIKISEALRRFGGIAEEIVK